MSDLLSVYMSVSRRTLLLIAAVLVVSIAAIDWLTKPYVSIGFLYLFPIMIMAGVVSRGQTIAVALLCAMLQEAYSNLPANEAVTRLILSSAGFLGTGLFVAELMRNRRMALQHIVELEGQVRLRREAEDQLGILVDSSPAAIVIIDGGGKILLANDAARELLAPRVGELANKNIGDYIPSLQATVATAPPQVLRTAMQCAGTRDNGEAFLSWVWFSTYATMSETRLAAIIVDLSEDLRTREELSLDHVLKHARIALSAMAHEIRNLSGAAQIVHKNLSRVKELQQSDDFRALSTVIEGLERVSALEPGPFGSQNAAAVDVTSVLDEVRVLIEGALRESAIDLEWCIHEGLPLVWADRHGLVQVFLNLARNSRAALRSSSRKRVRMSAAEEDRMLVIRFEDTGVGVSAPERLFRPFHGGGSMGLGLYISRAVMRSFGGELVHEPCYSGCCFAVRIPTV